MSSVRMLWLCTWGQKRLYNTVGSPESVQQQANKNGNGQQLNRKSQGSCHGDKSQRLPKGAQGTGFCGNPWALRGSLLSLAPGVCSGTASPGQTGFPKMHQQSSLSVNWAKRGRENTLFHIASFK